MDQDKLVLEFKSLMDEAKAKFLETGELSKATQAELTAAKKDFEAKLAAIETKIASGPQVTTPEYKTLGSTFIGSANYKNFATNGMQTTGKVNVGTFAAGYKAIVNSTGTAQPLVGPDRQAGIVYGAERALTVRDLLPVSGTNSNMVEFGKENVFTNNAAPQYVSPDFENVAKGVSTITFTLGTAPVRTIAHYLEVSNQVLEDSAQLEGYINNRLMYGLKLKEEDQLLNGDGTGGNLTGLITGGTAYDTGLTVSGDTQIDVIRHALYQVQSAEYTPTAIVLNSEDWHDIELIKDSGATTGMYVFGNPVNGGRANLWGYPVVVSNSITSGSFLVGAFDMAAQIFDRRDATIELTKYNADNFVKNMVTILAEERIALAIFRSASLVAGSF